MRLEKQGRFVRAALILLAGVFPAALPVRADNLGSPMGALSHSKLGFSLNAGLYQRDVEFKKDLNDYGAFGERKVVLTSIRPIVIKAQLNIYEWVNPYGVFGIADLRLDENGYEGTMKPFFGGGVSVKLLDSLEVGPDIGAQAHAVYTFSDAYLPSAGSGLVADLNYLEIQGALFCHKRISNFIPFIGIMFSETFASKISGNGDVEYGARSIPIGMFAGLDYFLTPNLYIHSELHNFVEDAIILGLGFNL